MLYALLTIPHSVSATVNSSKNCLLRFIEHVQKSRVREESISKNCVLRCASFISFCIRQDLVATIKVCIVPKIEILASWVNYRERKQSILADPMPMPERS
jgi:hypothetical protein